jgi:bifunctional non-homologous end joining protein LigD
MPEDAQLQEYRKRRNFRRTHEPKGGRPSKSGRRYLIQRHAARRLHYDLRLEHEGVLKSWAVTKGPSLDPSHKRLAIQTEDHPMEYGDFEGTIPEGEYGAGTVMLWDEGEWEPSGDPDEGFKVGKLKFRLHGERLNGGWTLVRMRGRKGEKHANWLLIKERDETAREDGDARLEAEDTSVRSGRIMRAITEGQAVWSSRQGRKAATRPKDSSSAEAKSSTRVGSARLPKFVSPHLATLVDTAPEGDNWLHEIKYDGYRILAAVAGGKAAVRTRKGIDWTDKFLAIADAIRDLPCRSAQIDGEVAVADDAGRTDFGALQNALSTGKGGIGYYVFDLLSLDGNDLRDTPLLERKARLKALLGRHRTDVLRYCDHVAGHGSEVFEQACELGLEGIISKRADASYRSGRTRNWLKVKCAMGQEFVVVGWSPSTVTGRAFSSLLLGVHQGDGLRYAGRVGSGFSDSDLEAIGKLLNALERKTPAAEGVPKQLARKARFVRPDLVVEIALRGWTGENRIRQGSFKGLRTDKPACEIARESSVSPGTSVMEREDERTVAGIHITNPDRVLYPEQGVTKQSLVDYYLAVADRMLPHVVNRPLALVRCPSGHDQECFFQKHASPGFPDAFKAVAIKEKSTKDAYLYIDGVGGLVAAAQMGVLEIHLWGCRTDKVERPDRLVFDLDPDEGIPFDRVKDAARDLRGRLDELGLTSFPLATGGKGLHIVVPLIPSHDWDDHKAFAEAIARLMAEESPDRYVAVASKTRRRGKIFIDYLRNGRGASSIAPYSSRAKAGAPVALPVSWRTLGRVKGARLARVSEARKVVRRKDPWEGYFDVHQALPLSKVKG